MKKFNFENLNIALPMTIIAIMIVMVVGIMSASSTKQLESMSLDPRTNPENPERGFLNQKEHTYFVVLHVPRDHSIEMLRNLRGVREETKTLLDGNGIEFGEEAFEEKDFFKNGLLYKWDSSENAFFADIGVYFIDLLEFPDLIDAWDIQYYPEYMIVSPPKSLMNHDTLEEVRLNNRGVLFRSFGSKENTELLDEIRYISEFGVPTNPGQVSVTQIRGQEELLGYVYKELSCSLESENEEGIEYCSKVDVTVQFLTNIENEEIILDMSNFKARDMKGDWQTDISGQNFAEIHYEEKKELTFTIEIDEKTETIEIVYNSQIWESQETGEDGMYPFYLRIRIR